MTVGVSHILDVDFCGLDSWLSGFRGRCRSHIHLPSAYPLEESLRRLLPDSLRWICSDLT